MAKILLRHTRGVNKIYFAHIYNPVYKNNKNLFLIIRHEQRHLGVKYQLYKEGMIRTTPSKTQTNPYNVPGIGQAILIGLNAVNRLNQKKYLLNIERIKIIYYPSILTVSAANRTGNIIQLKSKNTNNSRLCLR